MKLRFMVIAIALCGMAVACKTGPEEGVDAEPTITGEYNLVSIDGNPIPYAPMHLDRQQPTVVAGTLTLREGGAFASTMQYADASGKSMSRVFAGTYTFDGTAFVLQWQGAGTTSVTIEENTLTMNNEGMLFVYKK